MISSATKCMSWRCRGRVVVNSMGQAEAGGKPGDGASVGRKPGWWGGGLVVLLLSILLNGCTPESRVTFLTNEAYFDTLIAYMAWGKREIVICIFVVASGDSEGNRVN